MATEHQRIFRDPILIAPEPTEKEKHSSSEWARSIRQNPYVGYGNHNTMGSFLGQFVHSLEVDLRTSRRVGKDEYTASTHILAIIGMAGTGKDFNARLMTQFIMSTEEGQLLRLSTALKNVDYDEEGEEEARKMGLVVTPRDQVFQDHEINNSTEVLGDGLVELIDNPFVMSVIAKFPGFKVPGITEPWRDYGESMLTDLIKHNGKFEGKSYRLSLCVINGSPLLRLLSVYGRYEINYIAEKLEQAQKIAKLYGMPIPQDEAEWKSMMGASIEQIELMEDKQRELYERLSDDTHIPMRLPTRRNFRAKLDGGLATLIKEDDIEKYYWKWARPQAIMDNLILRLNPSPNRLFVFDNDVDLSSMNINISALSEHIQQNKDDGVYQQRKPWM